MFLLKFVTLISSEKMEVAMFQDVLYNQFLGDFKEHEKSNLDWGIDFQLHCIGSLPHFMENSIVDSMYNILPDDFSNLKFCVSGNIIKQKIKICLVMLNLFLSQYIYLPIYIF